MRLVYVFDCRCGCTDCYVLRCPALLARVICRWARRALDYAPTPAGL